MASYMLSSPNIKQEAPQDVFYDSHQSFNNATNAPVTTTSGDNAQSSRLQPTNAAVTGSIGQALLKPTLHDKCQALTIALAESTNIKELQYQYPIIIQKIFGFGAYHPGWQIEIINIGRSRRDSNAVQALLHPNGPLFTHLIHKLLSEDVAFEFPYTSIPEATRRKVEEGLPISELYGNKLTVGGSQPMLILDAFEYFFFVFAHKMVSSSTKSQELYLEPCDWLYPTLLNDYMQYFLPMTGIPQSLPPPKQSSMQSHRAGSALSTPRRQGMGLLKQSSSQFSRSISVQQSSSSDTVDTDVMWSSEKLVQVLAELWMGQTCIDLAPNNTSLRFSSSPTRYYDWSGEVGGVSLIDALCTNEGLPSHDLIMLIRMFLKHIHAFIHTADGNVLPSDHQNPTTILGALKRNLLARYIQKPLYGFLKHSIEKWPLDTSFRPILETWLSFIRPWRYACAANRSQPGTPDSGEENSGVDMTNFTRNWGGFVKAHCLFYTVLFQDVVTRFLRIDLTSAKMAYHLSRVCRVFSVEELISIIRDVDMSVISAPYAFQDSYSDVTAGVMGNSQLMLANQINAIESPSFIYRPMFCDEVAQQVQCLVQQLVNAQQHVKRKMEVNSSSHKSNQGSSFFGMFGLNQMTQFNDTMAGNQDTELASADRWLEQSTTELCYIYNIERPGYDYSSERNSDSTSGNLPDHVVKADGSVELTALGRYQVLNGLKRFPNITSHCDQELLPVRSYESDIGVIQLYKLSCALNKKFGDYFSQQYNKDGIAGCIARRLLIKPLKDGDGGMYPHHRNPRISLRMLANYHFLGYILIGYLVLSMALGRLPTVLFGLFLFGMYILCLALMDYVKERS